MAADSSPPLPTDASSRSSFSDAWHRFFHATLRPEPLAAVRIGLCMALLLGVLLRVPHARLLVSSEGAAAPFFPELAALVPGGSLAVALYAVLAVCLLAGAIGWQTRVALLTAAVLLPYLGLLDGLTTMTKYTVIGTHALLLLGLGSPAAVWSVDAWRDPARFARSHVAAWPVRLLQILLCVLYFGTAVTKVQVPAYHTGEHMMFWMLTDINTPHPVGHWLAARPTLAIVAAEVALLWEALFLAVVWVRPLRPWVLALGVGFHVGTFVLFGLWLFPLVMLALYPIFLTAERLAAVGRWFAQRFDRLPTRPLPRPAFSAAAFALLLGAVSVTAVEAEYRLDPLNQRHPERRPAARELPAAEAAELLAGTPSPGPADWIHRVDLGTTLAAGTVVASERPLAVGEPPLVQVWIHRPHADFWLQTDLHRLDGGRDHLLIPGGQAILREQGSVLIPFDERTKLQPGQYAIVLKYNGEELWRRPFTVTE